MTAAVIVLAVLVGPSLVWGGLCTLAARSAFGHSNELADALVKAEDRAEEFRSCLDLYERLLAGDDIDTARAHQEWEALARRLEREIGPIETEDMQ